MKIAHIADIHLGFRQFQRQTPKGINQREADVAVAFERAVDGIIQYDPDVLLVAGDLFHTVRPTNPAILHSFKQFQKIREALPELQIVIIAGNHDTPRSVETGAILKLFETFGISVVTDREKRIHFPELDLSVLCVPHTVVRGQRPAFTPDDSSRWNVLLMHGEVAGVISRPYSPVDPVSIVERDELRASSWSYVAMGHYHVAHEVAPNAWYSGSLEYVGTNSWGELRDEESNGRKGKGWLAVELGEKLVVDFVPVELNRKRIDLQPIEATGLVASKLDSEIAARVAGVAGGIDGHVVRQLVWNVSRSIRRELEHDKIREFRKKALHYQLDLKTPEPSREIGVSSPGAKMSIPELMVDYLERTPLDADVDRKELIALARRHLDSLGVDDEAS
jgi:exonuclease SbcD